MKIADKQSAMIQPENSPCPSSFLPVLYNNHRDHGSDDDCDYPLFSGKVGNTRVRRHRLQIPLINEIMGGMKKDRGFHRP